MILVHMNICSYIITTIALCQLLFQTNYQCMRNVYGSAIRFFAIRTSEEIVITGNAKTARRVRLYGGRL